MKNYNDFLETPQILYEIALSIGTSLDLKTMAKNCLQVMLKKLNCTAGGIYQFAPSKQTEESIDLICSIPRNTKRNVLYTAAHQKAVELLEENQTGITIFFHEDEDQHFYLFPLPSFGFLLLVKKGAPLNNAIRKSLETLTAKLANAAIACEKDKLLRQRERLLQTVLNTIPQAVFWKGRDSRYLGVNKAFAQDAGFSSPDELIGKSDYDMLWTKDEAALFVEADRHVMATNVAKIGIVEPQIQSDGKQAWLRTNKVPILNRHGEVMGILGTYEDITEAKNQEKEVKYLANLLEQVSEAIISVDMQFIIRSWNKGAEKIYGYSAEEAIGKSIGDLIETEYDDYEAGDGSRILLETGIFEARAVQTTAHKKKLYIASSSSLLRDEDGNPTGMVAINRDIGELIKSEQQRNRLTRIIQETSDFVGIADVNGNALFLNLAGRKMVGIEEQADLAGKHLKDFHPAEMVQLLTKDAFPIAEKEGVWQGDSEMLTADGQIIPASQVLIAQYDRQGKVDAYATIMREMSEQVETTRQLRNQSERLELAMSSGNIAMWEWSILTNEVYWSGNVAAVFGVDKAVFGQSFEQYNSLIHPDDIDYVQSALVDSVENNIPYNIEHRLIHPEGNIGWLNIISTVTHDEDGSPLQMLGTAQNITKRKQNELAIRRSLQRRNDETRLITEIAQSIAGATSLPELYKQVVWLVKEQFDYYHTQLLHYDPALESVTLIVGYGDVGKQMLALNHSMPVGVGLIGTAVAQKRPMLRSDVSQDHNWRPNPLLSQTKGELAVPILMQDKVLGVLDVQSAAAGQLNENDQFLLEGLCGQIAVAIESTRLREEMELHIQELSALQRYFVREGWDTRLANSGANEQGYLYKRGELLPISDAGVNENGRMRKSSLAVRGEEIGQIGIAVSDEEDLTVEDEQFLQAVSRQVAEALESVRLMEQTQSSLFAQEQLTSDLQTVAEVSATASEALELDMLLKAVVDLTKKRFNLYHAQVYLTDEWQMLLELKAGAGDVGQLMVLEGQTVAIDDRSVLGRAANGQEVVIVNDVHQSDYFISHPLLPNTKSQMAVPLIVGDSLLGVLDCHANRLGRFDEQDVMIMKTLASQIAVSLQNAYLYTEQVETADKLRSVDQLKSEFLASMSHELRTPLNSIIGFADVLLEGFDGPLTERMEEDVRLIRDSGRHLKSLIGDILDLSKIEAGRMELRYEQVDINQLAKDVVATSMSLAQEKSLHLDLQTDDTITTIPCDQVRIRQVLINVVGNGIKFTEKGSVTVKTTNHDDHVLLSIQDTGIGIEQEDIDIVFEQFRQVDGSMTRAAGGTGLGMPISKKLVELHGGAIWVESVVGEGSTFNFTIPHEPSYRPPETDSLGL